MLLFILLIFVEIILCITTLFLLLYSKYVLAAICTVLSIGIGVIIAKLGKKIDEGNIAKYYEEDSDLGIIHIHNANDHTMKLDYKITDGPWTNKDLKNYPSSFTKFFIKAGVYTMDVICIFSKKDKNNPNYFHREGDTTIKIKIEPHKYYELKFDRATQEYKFEEKTPKGKIAKTIETMKSL